MNTNGDAILGAHYREKREEPSKWMFECDHCYGKFPTKKDLTAHQQRKLFKCPFKCPQKFTHKDELVTHERVCRGRVREGNFDNYKIYQLM